MAKLKKSTANRGRHYLAQRYDDSFTATTKCHEPRAKKKGTRKPTMPISSKQKQKGVSEKECGRWRCGGCYIAEPSNRSYLQR